MTPSPDDFADWVYGIIWARTVFCPRGRHIFRCAALDESGNVLRCARDASGNPSSRRGAGDETPPTSSPPGEEESKLLRRPAKKNQNFFAALADDETAHTSCAGAGAAMKPETSTDLPEAGSHPMNEHLRR